MEELKPFISVVIPAHNEEAYIEETLRCLTQLEYPHDRIEVIVVENGSSDATAARARAFTGLPLTVVSIPIKGVSAARNHGAMLSRKDADWVLFLDADTHIQPRFLKMALKYVSLPGHERYVIGTFSPWPWPMTLPSLFLYMFSNIGFFIFETPYEGVLLVKRELLAKGVTFDEYIQAGEGFGLQEQARKEGDFFFLWTTQARTSTRRFSHGGWAKIPLWVSMWMFAKIVPVHVQRRFKYETIR